MHVQTQTQRQTASLKILLVFQYNCYLDLLKNDENNLASYSFVNALFKFEIDSSVPMYIQSCQVF